MALSIFKYELEIRSGGQIIEMPMDSVILSFQNQPNMIRGELRNKAVIWALVNDSFQIGPRNLYLTITGKSFGQDYPIEFLQKYDYVGTVNFDDHGNDYVLHLFAEKP